MRFEDVSDKLLGVPFISIRDARWIYNYIIENNAKHILELGIAHGTATCYMAAALDEIGDGKITAVDLLETKDSFSPSAEEQLNRLGFSYFVDIHRMKTGYTWYLHDKIKEETVDGMCGQVYDLCIIDGPKNWTIDGAAFFMVDKLLKQNGLIIFDDYEWTYQAADTRRDQTDGITHRNLSEVERSTPHIRDVFEFLVKQHPSYSNFLVFDNNWAMAKKIHSDIKKTVYLERHEVTYRDIKNKIAAKLKKAISKQRKIKDKIDQ
jgi:predicted O-methyltransferase YrrM